MAEDDMYAFKNDKGQLAFGNERLSDCVELLKALEYNRAEYVLHTLRIFYNYLL